MPTITDQAIVLRRWDYSETSQTVSLLTREHGILRGLAKGAKRERSKFSGGFEPLTRGEVVAIVRPSLSLANLIEWDLQEVFRAPRASLAAHGPALYLVDVTDHMLTEADPHPELYDGLLACLRDLEREDPSGVVLRHQWAALVETGHKPSLEPPAQSDPDAPSYAFDPGAGRLAPDPGGAADHALWRVRRETIELLRRLDAPPGAAQPTPAEPPEVVRRANRLLGAYIRWLLGRELPSANVALRAEIGVTRENPGEPPQRVGGGR